MIKRLPNFITFIRLILIPVFVFLMIDPSPSMVYAALAIFIFAAITDFFDGWLARRVGGVSDFGKLLDPIADKILVMSALVMLVAQRSDVYGDPWIPGWMIVIILAREIWVMGVRTVAASRGTIISAGESGKWKSALQMIAIVFVMLKDLSLEIFSLNVTCQIIGLNLLVLSILFSYWGAVDYTFAVFGGEKE